MTDDLVVRPCPLAREEGFRASSPKLEKIGKILVFVPPPPENRKTLAEIWKIALKIGFGSIFRFFG